MDAEVWHPQGHGTKTGWLLEETGFQGRSHKPGWSPGGEAPSRGPLSSTSSIHSPFIHSRLGENSQRDEWELAIDQRAGPSQRCPRPGGTCLLSARRRFTQVSLLVPQTAQQERLGFTHFIHKKAEPQEIHSSLHLGLQMATEGLVGGGGGEDEGSVRQPQPLSALQPEKCP